MGKRTGIQLFYPFEEKRLAKWSPPYIVQPKLDGERCRCLLARGEAVMLSSEENVITSVPDIQAELKQFSREVGWTYELDGELYRHQMPFEDIHSIVGRTVNLNPDHGLMEYHVFDLVDETLNQAQRLKKLGKLLAGRKNSRIKLVPLQMAWSLDEVRKAFDYFISLGYEGIIIRNFEAPYLRRRSTFGMKFKPKKSDLYPITGFVEGHGKYSETIGAIICESDGQQFEVGSFSLTDERRKELWFKRFELTKFNCKVGYQHRWSSGKPKSGVFLELVEKPKEVKFVNPLG